MDKTIKKTWRKPQLTVHGAIEELTSQVNKAFGPGDGFLLVPNNPPIAIRSV